jgi:hypothetical protein
VSSKLRQRSTSVHLPDHAYDNLYGRPQKEMKERTIAYDCLVCAATITIAVPPLDISDQMQTLYTKTWALKPPYTLTNRTRVSLVNIHIAYKS